jgi:hypothetical protein
VLDRRPGRLRSLPLPLGRLDLSTSSRLFLLIDGLDIGSGRDAFLLGLSGSDGESGRNGSVFDGFLLDLERVGDDVGFR